MGTMMRTLVAALTACLVCLSLAGCDSKSSSAGGSGTATGQKREVRSEARAAPGGGSTAMMTREEAEGPGDSPDE